MIRRGDQVRLSLQKLRLRKRRAAFAVISVALGVVVVVTANSLFQGIRNVAITTMSTEEMDKDVIRVSTSGNDYVPDDERRDKKTKKRYQFLTEALLDEMRAWSGVEAADRPVQVYPVRIDIWENNPQPVTVIQGASAALLSRYVTDPAVLSAGTNAIPLVIGERLTRLRFDPKTKKLVTDPESATNSWIGREVTIVLGDNYTGVRKYDFDYEKRVYNERDPGDVTAQRDNLERGLRNQYDLSIYNTTLNLKARVVGLRPGNKLMMPMDEAELCEKWLDQRRRLAALRNLPTEQESDVDAYEARGRRVPKTGEFTEAVVVVKPGADIEAISKKIDDMGFYATTRQRAFEREVHEFDSFMRVVKYVVYTFAGVLLGIAFGLLWSTTSRVVSDSRVDIGLFRAIGATKSDIRRLFLSESALLGALGTLAGMILGWLIASGISHWVISFARRETTDPEESLLIPKSIFAIDWKFSLMLLAGAVVVALLAGLRPASRAANVDPVKALKRE